MELLISTVAKAKRNINPSLGFDGILITMHNGRLRFSKSIISDLQEVYGQHIPIYENTILQSVKAVENTAVGKSLFKYNSKCKASIAYEEFAKEVHVNG